MSARTIENYEPADNLLEGRLVMVTGAGDGIGKAAAVSYAAHGASVILLGKTIKKLEKVYDEIEAAGYPEAVILPLDLQGPRRRIMQRWRSGLRRTSGGLMGCCITPVSLGI